MFLSHFYMPVTPLITRPIVSRSPKAVFSFPMEAMAGMSSGGVSPFHIRRTVLTKSGIEMNVRSRNIEPYGLKNAIQKMKT